MDLDLAIASFASVAALGSLLISIRGHRVAARALLLAEKESVAKEQSVELYLVDSWMWGDSDKLFFAFSVIATNRSTIPNGIVRAELELVYIAKGDANRVVRLSHTAPEKLPDESKISVDRGADFRLPCSIDPQESIGGSLFFSVSRSFVANKDVQEHRVRLTTTAGVAPRVSVYLMKEVIVGAEE